MQNNILNIISYINEELKVDEISWYTKTGDIIKFNNSEFSNEAIHYEDINIKFQKNSFFNNSTKNITGIYKNEFFSGTIYYEKEKFLNIPYKYMKIFGNNLNDYNGVLTFTNYVFNGKTQSNLYLNYNENIIRDKTSKISNDVYNDYIIKCYNHNYYLNYEELTMKSTGCKKIKIGTCKYNLEQQKKFSKFKIKFINQRGLIITYSL